MADIEFNIALGKVVGYYDRVQQNDGANSALTLVVINTTATDATLKDLTTLSAVLGDANTAEVTNGGYARIELTDADLSASAPDNTNDRMDLDFADQTFPLILAGDAWTDLIICYDPDTTAGTDADLIPLLQYDFAFTPDGSDIQAKLNEAGFFRAQQA